MVDLGATTAYNIDGGGSSTMYFDGSLVNNPLGGATPNAIPPTSSTSRPVRDDLPDPGLRTRRYAARPGAFPAQRRPVRGGCRGRRRQRPGFAEMFRAAAGMGATVIRHAANCGKGAALKTGFAYIARRYPGHAGRLCRRRRPAPGRRHPARRPTGSAAPGRPRSSGCGRFGREVPLRSRFGNKLTGLLFRATSGQRMVDTQTGLRGFSADLMPLAAVGRRRPLRVRAEPAAARPLAGVLLDHSVDIGPSTWTATPRRTSGRWSTRSGSTGRC